MSSASQENNTIPSSSIKVLKCRKCFQISANPLEHHPSYRHCYICLCSNPNCLEFWYVCPQHELRFTSSRYSRMRDHFLNIPHGEFPLTCSLAGTNIADLDEFQSNNDTFLPFDSTDFTEQSDNQDDTIEPSSKRLKEVHCTLSKNTNPNLDESLLPIHSKRFFNDDILNDGTGICGLVGRSFRQDLDSNIQANDFESNLQLNITHFCSSLTQNQQKDFASIIASVLNPDSFTSTRPPMSFNDINKFYISSQSSIFKNIPSPNIFEFDNHACVSIESIINHMLAFGVELNTINLQSNYKEASLSNQSIETTKEVKHIVQTVKEQIPNVEQTNPIVIYVILWSDDFEANHTRKNRNSTWLKTITVCPPSSQSTSSKYTYPIALGRKGQSHDVVNNFFNDELKRISSCTLRYCKKFKQLYPVIVKPLCISADRPERSTLNSILSHNGTSTKRWMYSELTPRNKLPSCMKCFKHRCKNISSPNTLSQGNRNSCKRCCDWNMSDKKRTSYFLPPTHYPATKHHNSPPPPFGRDVCKPFEKLPPIRVTYTILIEATKFGFWNYLHQTWNKSQTHSYFRLIGISTMFFHTIIAQADHHRKYLPVSHSILDKITLPAMWTSSFRLEQCIDTPMHLLFQGITKTIIEESKEYLKHHKIWSQFGRHSNELMDDVSSVHIDFCKVESFNGGTEYTTGGWIAETYIGFARLSSVLFSYVSETLPPSTLALNEFQCMVQSLSCLISRLMTSVFVTSDEINNYVKMFLSCCRIYHNVFYDNNESTKNPFWNSPNFLSLLNLPKQIEQFGSMRLHWEGVHERFIQNIKPYLKNMRSSTSFLLTKLDSIHRNNVLKNFLINDLSTKKKYSRFNDKKKYKSIQNVEQYIALGNTLLGIFYKLPDNDVGFGLLFDDTSNNCLIKLVFSDHLGYHLNRLWFTPISIGDTVSLSDDYISSCILDSVIIIPTKTFEDDIIRYTLIGKSWQVRHHDGTYSLPQISQHGLEQF